MQCLLLLLELLHCRRIGAGIHTDWDDAYEAGRAHLESLWPARLDEAARREQVLYLRHVLREFANARATVGRADLDLEHHGQRLPLVNARVVDGDLLSGGGGHEPELGEAPAAVLVEVKVRVGQIRRAAEAAVEDQAFGQRHDAGHLADRRGKRADGGGEEVVGLLELVEEVCRLVAEDRVVDDVLPADRRVSLFAIKPPACPALPVSTYTQSLRIRHTHIRAHSP